MEVENSIKVDDILSDLNKSTFDSNLAESVVAVDIGHLMAFDPRPIDSAEFKKNKEIFLLNLCTQGTQLIVNNLFKLPTERVEDTIVAKLTKGNTILPREKPLPKAKPLTKWEQYAKLKGIKKKKKGRKVFDEASQEWKPIWGMGRAKDNTKDWLIEIPKTEKDPNQDFFAKRTSEKTERVAKNELQRLRNIARASKKKVPGVGLTPTQPDKADEKFRVKLIEN
jgi:regulator of ribosome biosynthesis